MIKYRHQSTDALGVISFNIIVYADDIVVLAPSVKALQALIALTVKTAETMGLHVNEKKTKCMVVRHKKNCKNWNSILPFSIGHKHIDFVSSYKYLGFVIMDDMSIKDDISRALSKFYTDINMILRKFSYADKEVKLYLFKQYCLQIYGSEFWLRGHSVGSSAVLRQFSVSYHSAIKKLLNLSSHESNNFACQEAQLLTFQHFINKIKIMSTLRLFSQPCHFIRKILDYLYIKSCLLKDVINILKVEYDIDSLLDNDREAMFARICYVQNHENQMRLSW